MAYRKWLIILLAAWMPMTGITELRDPTRPFQPMQAETSTHHQNDELSLSAIWISAKNRRATINGISAKQGQTILNDVKIIRIRHNSVTIQQNGLFKTLYLLQRPYQIR